MRVRRDWRQAPKCLALCGRCLTDPACSKSSGPGVGVVELPTYARCYFRSHLGSSPSGTRRIEAPESALKGRPRPRRLVRSEPHSSLARTFVPLQSSPLWRSSQKESQKATLQEMKEEMQELRIGLRSLCQHSTYVGPVQYQCSASAVPAQHALRSTQSRSNSLVRIV